MNRHLVAACLAASAILCLGQPSVAQNEDEPAQAQERIRSFDSHISLSPDGNLEVRETIEVQAAGLQIRHGIYRDFPTRYRDRLGNRYSVAFAIVGVERDGNPEPYHTEGTSDGVRIYFGDKNTLVSSGIHHYGFTYTAARELGFFRDHDELFWNVTSVGWVFPIDVAKATVVLPPQVHNFVTGTDSYVGAKGEKQKRVTTSRDPDGNLQFRTENLAVHEGLSIVVAWPKGLIAEPTTEQKLKWFLGDNRNAAVGLAGLGLVLLYYLAVWIKVGRDPKAGTIVPLYEPPDNMSPAAMRYLEKMGFDEKTFTSAIIGLAAKGHLSIEQEHSGAYHLTQKPDSGKAVALSSDERVLKQKLFENRQTVSVSSGSSVVIRNAQKALSTALHTGMEKTYFVTNAGYIWPGIALTLLSAIAMLVATGQVDSGQLPVAIFITIWLSGWSVGVGALLHAVARAWKAARAGGVLGRAGAMGITLFSIPFVIGELVGLGVLAWAVSVVACLVLLLLIGSNVLFHHLLKAPTMAGRQLLDRIEGFKMFLKEVDAQRLNIMSATPGKTPELFERFLPYALALDVEHAWAEQFSQVLATAGALDREAGTYSPSWYSGAVLASSPAAFTSSFSSAFSGAISSSSSPPGSSSGSSGGGSSGGGGGGGGGGGW